MSRDREHLEKLKDEVIEKLAELYKDLHDIERDALFFSLHILAKHRLLELEEKIETQHLASPEKEKNEQTN